jgi:copper/silver efflux system protein
MINKILLFFLENKLVTFLLLTVFIIWGIITSPFGWNTGFLPSDPVAVDAIPDIGENQQIVYVEWPGQSPQDIDDQVTYPLTTALLGMPGVKTIRSNSMFGLSSIYVIFDDDVDFYWSRTRILEKLNSLPSGTLPAGLTPALGPDATALGQIFWFTLEGRDENGKPNGGWDPHELRTIQDYYVKYALTSVSGVSEVASVGGFVKEYQVEMDPMAMKAYGVSINQIMQAVKNSNIDIGARTIEFNRAEYFIRSLGYIKNLEDLEKSVITVNNNVPIRLKDVAKIQFGPADRRGGLDKGGMEAVGGVVVARFGENPLQVINKVKEKITEISTGLPSKTLADGSTSKVTIIPFYDRTGLIKETLGTLNDALLFQILISIIVVIILVFNLRASFLISSLLPIGVLMTFIFMRYLNIDANIVALSGIAIAIGVMVDVGTIFTENILKHIESKDEKNSLLKLIFNASKEVAPAVLTAISTTIISFLPIFALQAAEGKLFKPLAFTKTFAMISALIIGLLIIPAMAHVIFSIRFNKQHIHKYLNIILILTGVILILFGGTFLALFLCLMGFNNLLKDRWPQHKNHFVNIINVGISLFVILYFLTKNWMPLGLQFSLFSNFVFIAFLIALTLGVIYTVIHYYSSILTWCLENKRKFLSFPLLFIFIGIMIWQGFDNMFRFMPDFLRQSRAWQSANNTFPGIGKEFMPALDEGSFLLMPTTMPHSGVDENLEVIRLLDMKVNSIPEVENVVGKWGRTDSALDPAPISMFENIINYKSEYILNEDGERARFKVNDEDAFVLLDGRTYNPQKDDFLVITKNELIEDEDGENFRQWRDFIKSPDDIWNEIVNQMQIPGLTSAPKLQPIQTRLVMLQTGMRAPMGMKIYGPDLESIEQVGFEMERYLKQVEGVKPASVFADRTVGKPYLEIKINRDAISRFGLTVKDIQSQLSAAVGGITLTSTVEGRERFAVRARYARDYRNSPDKLKNIPIQTAAKVFIPLSQLAFIEYTPGPQLIKSENTFLVGYVIFDKMDEYAEVDVVENAEKYLNQKINDGKLKIPKSVHYIFTGNYENQIRANKQLLIIVPVALIVIFLILYFQFRSVPVAGFIFSGILVAFSGGFILLWLYDHSWFMNISIFGAQFRDILQIQTINLSVAVWVGFIALFGIATDDGVLISTYLKQIFDKSIPKNTSEIRSLVLEAGKKRIRPAMMTTATTIIALFPVLTSTGKGSDIMIPMAIPMVGGMMMAILTVFIVPVLFSAWQEYKLKNVKGE